MDDRSERSLDLVSVFRWGYHGAPARAGHLQAGSKPVLPPSALSSPGDPRRPGNFSRFSETEPAARQGNAREEKPRIPGSTDQVAAVSSESKENRSASANESIRVVQAPRHAPADGLDHWVQAVRACQSCGLGQTRHVPVCGSGSNHPEVLILGSIPGYEEDQVGVPFVSGSGQYLDKWLEAIGLDRYKSCYLSYILHCHGQIAKGAEANVPACRPHLERLLLILVPKVILCVGKTSADWLMGSDTGTPDTTLRTYQGIPVLVSHEPGEVLRDPKLKRQVWDVLRLMKARFLA